MTRASRRRPSSAGGRADAGKRTAAEAAAFGVAVRGGLAGTSTPSVETRGRAGPAFRPSGTSSEGSGSVPPPTSRPSPRR